MLHKFAIFTLLLLTCCLFNVSAQTQTPTPESSKSKERPKGNFVIDPSAVREETSVNQAETNPAVSGSSKIGTINKGVLNGAALSLPIPPYPAAARAVKASGAVNVQVSIDEEGNVTTAIAVSGHPLLRQTAEQAARESKFKPTLLEGQPVKVNGIIVYNFIPVSPIVEKTEWLRRSVVLTSIGKNKWQPSSERLVNNALKAFSNETFSYENELLLSILKKPEERAEIIDKIYSSLKSKLTASEVWQLELGEAIVETVLEARNKISNPAYQFDENKVKNNLNKIRELSYSVTVETPVELIEALKPIIEMADNTNLKSPESLDKLMRSLMQAMKTVSP